LRLRIELFKNGVKNIEHQHLGRLFQSEYSAYIDALRFDPEKDGEIARKLEPILASAKSAKVYSSGGSELVYVLLFFYAFWYWYSQNFVGLWI